MSRRPGQLVSITQVVLVLGHGSTDKLPPVNGLGRSWSGHALRAPREKRRGRQGVGAQEGYGRFLLAVALLRSVCSEIASFAVIVDAKDDDARRFYERESFLPLLDQPMKPVSAYGGYRYAVLIETVHGMRIGVVSRRLSRRAEECSVWHFTSDPSSNVYC